MKKFDYILPTHILRKSSMPSGLARKDINKIFGAAPVDAAPEPDAETAAPPAPGEPAKPKRGPKPKHAAPAPEPDDNGGDDDNGADE